MRFNLGLYLVIFITVFCCASLSSAEKEQSLDPLDALLKSGRVVGQVYFDLMGKNLDSRAREEMDRVAGELSKLKGPFIVRVEGFSDSYREKRGGILLSMRRAQSVKLYMAERYPLLKAEFYMTGFGETRPLIPKEGESPEDIAEKERRVDVVVYHGATFFAEKKDVEVVTKLDLKRPPVRQVPVAKVAPEPEKKDIEVVTKPDLKRPPVRQVPLAKVAPEPFIPERGEFVVAARAFKRFIFPEEFFDTRGMLVDEAGPILDSILSGVKENGRWVFIAAATGAEGGEPREDGSALKKQIYMGHRLINAYGIDAGRVFIKGFYAPGGIARDSEGERGELYLYIPFY